MAYAPPGHTKYGEGEEYQLRADAALVYNVDEPKEAQIVAWRAECFERLGFPPLTASALAKRRDVDREHVTGLIRSGATPTQAADIVL